MVEDALSALEWYLKISTLDLPQGPCLAIRPDAHPILDQLSERGLTCYQTDYAQAQALKEQGLKVSMEMEGTYPLVLGLGTKFKEENLFHLASAYQHLELGGEFIFLIHNKLGAKSYLKYIQQLFGSVLSESKNRCKVYRAKKTSDQASEILNEWLAMGSLQVVDEGPLRTYPGTFSRKKIDPGSRLLAENLPFRMRGAGADLGAGYGYLSYAILQKDYTITALHLYEAEYRALEAAKANIAPLLPKDLEVSYHWHDVTQGIQHQKLDWIVMNPPFHLGKIADISIGEEFVRVAAKGLRRKGQLWMVANRHLPYEKILGKDFSSYEILADAEGYKVYRARK